MKPQRWYSAIGPGLIFAGTAIGVSHLVQSTRAGADYGYALVWAVVLANIFKYPFFEFGSRYAQATGTSLLSGYSKLGKWTLWVYFCITLASMFTVTGAVSFVTTALLDHFIEAGSGNWFYVIAFALYATCVIVLFFGKYKVLDKLIKVVAVLLTLSTLAAFVLVIFNPQPHVTTATSSTILEDEAMLIFAIALMGWMPTALDLSAWNSIWTVEKMKSLPQKLSLKQVLFDFKAGYLLSALLAIAFLVLGAELMHYSGKTFPDSAAGFVNSLLYLFTESLGEWSYPIIAVSAVSVMLSTTISVFDGYSRAMSETTQLLGFPKKLQYGFWLLITAIGGFLVISYFQDQLKTLVDVATIVSFIIAPIVGALNFKLIFSERTPKAAQPGQFSKVWSVLGLAFLTGFTCLYLWVTIS